MSLLVMTASRRLLYGHMHCSGVDLRVSWLSFRIFVLLKRPPSLPLHHPGIWQQIFIMNILVYFSVNTSFSYMKRTCAICWKKTAPQHDVPTSRLYYLCFWATWSASWPPNIPKSSVVVSSDQTIFSQYFTGLSKRAGACFFFSNWDLHGECAYRSWQLHNRNALYCYLPTCCNVVFAAAPYTIELWCTDDLITDTR